MKTKMPSEVSWLSSGCRCGLLEEEPPFGSTDARAGERALGDHAAHRHGLADEGAGVSVPSCPPATSPCTSPIWRTWTTATVRAQLPVAGSSVERLETEPSACASVRETWRPNRYRLPRSE